MRSRALFAIIASFILAWAPLEAGSCQTSADVKTFVEEFLDLVHSNDDNAIVARLSPNVMFVSDHIVEGRDAVRRNLQSLEPVLPLPETLWSIRSISVKVLSDDGAFVVAEVRGEWKEADYDWDEIHAISLKTAAHDPCTIEHWQIGGGLGR
jgi:hypothetical protein